jgi:hypothetical protein
MPRFAANILSLHEKSLGFPGDHSLALPAASPTYKHFDMSGWKTNIKEIKT